MLDHQIPESVRFVIGTSTTLIDPKSLVYFIHFHQRHVPSLHTYQDHDSRTPHLISAKARILEVFLDLHTCIFGRCSTVRRPVHLAAIRSFLRPSTPYGIHDCLRTFCCVTRWFTLADWNRTTSSQHSIAWKRACRLWSAAGCKGRCIKEME